MENPLNTFGDHDTVPVPPPFDIEFLPDQTGEVHDSADLREGSSTWILLNPGGTPSMQRSRQFPSAVGNPSSNILFVTITQIPEKSMTKPYIFTYMDEYYL